ncbi:lipid II:glycine glycyltransferase FemX [Yaniella halotolerans]|uniref:lipid II:glycine glycyltransferase FemX n=1 Tax=Yaniella halotolerans TaxID=225453 RepID=UPI0003B2EAD5|nr:peptidoglycan bridge formation glycyltransferase FemA/FemB family protein [Yaniella halotolerans]
MTHHKTLRIQEISVEQHHDFIAEQARASFLQNPVWPQTKPAWRSQSLGWFDDDELVAVSLVLYRPIPVPGLRGRSLAYLADGPLFDPDLYELDTLLEPLVPYTRSQGAFMIRMGLPFVLRRWDADDVRKALSAGEHGMIPELQPVETNNAAWTMEDTLVRHGWEKPELSEDFVAGQAQFQARIPLPQLTPERRANRDSPEFEQAVEEVLKRMDSTSRRQTRKSTRSELTVTSGGLADVAAWQALYEETAERDDFIGRPQSYFESMLKALNDSPTAQCKVLFAHYEDQLLASAIYVQQQDTGWYVYGASTRAESKRYAPRALQLEQIKLSLEAGAAWYDLGGVSATLNKEHELAGLTRFKTTMGADVVQTMGEWDYPINKLLARAFNMYLARRG